MSSDERPCDALARHSSFGEASTSRSCERVTILAQILLLLLRSSYTQHGRRAALKFRRRKRQIIFKRLQQAPLLGRGEFLTRFPHVCRRSGIMRNVHVNPELPSASPLRGWSRSSMCTSVSDLASLEEMKRWALRNLRVIFGRRRPGSQRRVFALSGQPLLPAA